MRDRLVSAAHRTGHAVDSTSRDMTNRARGVVAELRGRLSSVPVDDEVLRERVRARIGSLVGHPGAVEVGVVDGTVTLRGPVLADEVEGLVRRVRGVRGVRDTINQLDVHDEPGGVPALQGRPRSPRRGEVRELLPTRWSAATGLVAALTGAAVALWGLRRAARRRRYDAVSAGW
jgi:hypothetical protein